MWWLLPVFILNTMAFGGTIVIKINIILSLICQRYLSERTIMDPNFHFLPVSLGEKNAQCQIPQVQSLVSQFTLWGTLISGILGALTSPKLGALSDRYGRIPMIAVSVFCTILSEIVFLIVASHPETISVNVILLGYFFDGLGGSFISVMAISFAYASDCTPPSKRNVVFGYYQGCLFAGIALGPIVAGYFVKRTGNLLSIFYVAVACHLFFFLHLLFVVPESVTRERQLSARKKAESVKLAEDFVPFEFRWFYHNAKRLLSASNLLSPLSILFPVDAKPAVRRNLLFIAAVDTTMFGVAMGAMTVTLIYSEFVFGWGNFEASAFMSIVSSSRVIGLFVILPLITRVFRGAASRNTQQSSGCDQVDLGIIRLSIIFDFLGYVGYATVRRGELFIASGALSGLGGIGSPTLQSSLTKHVPPDRTGQVLGAMGLLHAAARVVAPVIFNSIYAATVGKFSQTVFVALAATWGVAFLLSLFIRPHGMSYLLILTMCSIIPDYVTVYWDAKLDETEDDQDDGHVVNGEHGDLWDQR